MRKVTDNDRKRRIQAILNDWVPMLALTDWQITWELVDTLDGEACGGGQAGARILSTGPYTRAHIMFTRSAIDDWATDMELDTAIIHELCHCLTSALREEIINCTGDSTPTTRVLLWQIETLCDKLATCFLHTSVGGSIAPTYSPVIREVK